MPTSIGAHWRTLASGRHDRLAARAVIPVEASAIQPASLGIVADLTGATPPGLHAATRESRVESDATIVAPMMLTALLEAKANPKAAAAIIKASRAETRKFLAKVR